jgi:hypothetical protein
LRIACSRVINTDDTQIIEARQYIFRRKCFFSWLPIGGLGEQDRSIQQAKPLTAHENMELRYRILSGKVAKVFVRQIRTAAKVVLDQSPLKVEIV